MIRPSDIVPGLVAFGPNGLILNYEYVGSELKSTVVQQLPLGFFHTRGVGLFPMVPGTLSGVQGTMRVTFTPGVAGVARSIAFLSDGVGNLIGVALTAGNAPYVIVTTASGTIYTSVGGPVLQTGQMATVELTWNSTTVLPSGLFADALQGDTHLSWAVSPIVPWTPFIPTKVILGIAQPAYVLSDLTSGQVDYFQCSSASTPPGSPLTWGVATLTNAILDSPTPGDLTLLGSYLTSVAPNVSFVTLSGPGIGYKVLTQAQIEAVLPGSFNSTSIAIDSSLLVGLAPGDQVTVTANSVTSNLLTVS